MSRVEKTTDDGCRAAHHPALRGGAEHVSVTHMPVCTSLAPLTAFAEAVHDLVDEVHFATSRRGRAKGKFC